MNQGVLEQLSMPVERAFGTLQTRIMEDIVRRIKINGFVTRSADWQITRLKQLGESEAYIKQQIKVALQVSEEEIEAIYAEAAKAEYIRNADLYTKAGSTLTDWADNKELQDLISACKAQTNDTLDNITGSLGYVSQEGTKIKAYDLSTFYQKTLDAAIGDIGSGSFDYGTVLKKTIAQMTNSGLRWIDYESGWHNRVVVAARRAVMTGFNQVMSHFNEQTARALGTDTYEVTWHMGARPSHQPWQGRVYTKQQLIDFCGLGTGNGLKGWNCYHDYLPFVPGASVRTYTDEWLDRQNAAENTPKAYKDKQYTTYEALQRQRQLETTMRAQRQQISLMKKGNANEDDIIDVTAWYRTTSAEYTDFSAKMGLPEQRERVLMDGLGSIGKGKYTKSSKWMATDFDTALLPRHLQDHLSDYPGFTSDDYVNRARELLNSPIGGSIEGFISAKGYVFRYNNLENDFATGKPNGMIETLFKPDRGRAYWKDQIAKYGKKGE